MDFDKIEDNMIVQNNKTKYLMAIECEGINYDLMSEVEKTAVEQGFIEFLNTLRHPIQLYIQTRTINISSSIENYNHKLEETRQELVSKQTEYTRLLQSNSGNTKILNELKMEIARIQNLYDYGKDIISNTEKMSLNKNVLRKHYYIILSYYASELGANITDEEEKNYGEWFRIDKKENGEWRGLETADENYVFDAIGYILKPSKQSEEKIDWRELYGELERGEYRLVKNISGKYIGVEFTIE